MDKANHRESLPFDILIVGAGPAGLSAALRLAELYKQKKVERSIAVLEKGSTVGAHILSGAILNPRTLNELIPDWKERGAPLNIPVKKDDFYYLTGQRAIRLPILKAMHNRGNYVISLAKFCQWLGEQAEAVGVHIFPGFAGQKILYGEDGRVIGVQTGDMGLNRSGKPGDPYEAGINIYAKHIILAEGCRGSLTQEVITHFNLRKENNPQTYAIGIKELWEIPADHYKPGHIIHTVGWPLGLKTYGGSFIYHYEENKLALGLVVGLDYRNPTLDPFKELQRLKHHPFLYDLLKNGSCIEYGARALNEGGWQAIPQLTFPGGLLAGCSAGFLNVAQLKGIHTAMKSGMLAAEAIVADDSGSKGELTAYTHTMARSWVAKELYQARNIRPSFRLGLWPGLIYSLVDQSLFRGKAPWTFTHRSDCSRLKPVSTCSMIIYPKPDGKISFDKLNQVYLARTTHREDQPNHLHIKNPQIETDITIAQYGAPEQYYCPAAVYEIVEKEGKRSLNIHASNCIHCKTCDIKDPTQNIVWSPPEGGSGPHYS